MKQEKNISRYWLCQLTGWLLAGLFWAFSAWTQVKASPFPNGFSFKLALLHLVFDVVIGIAVTHAYCAFAHKQGWIRLKLKSMPVRLVPMVIVMGIVYMLLVIMKLYMLRYYFSYGFNLSFGEFFSQNYLIVLASGIRLMAIWILAFHLYHYAVMEIGTAKEYAGMQVVARDAQLQQLSSQLNPHFFFNSLNSVKALINTDPIKARRAIDLLSDLLRTSLYGNNTRLIPLRDEIALVNDYLELEKIRFEERLHFSIHVNESLQGCQVLPLSIQTLVENAIKHGIAQQKNGGSIVVRVDKKEEQLTITVENTGVFKQVEGSIGLGLKNLEERLTWHYNNKASFAIQALPGAKVLSTLIIPAS